MRARHLPLIAALFVAFALAQPAAANEPEALPVKVMDEDGDAGEPIGELIVQGLSFLGTPYKFGGETRDTGLDCSGLVQRVFQNALGLDLPRTTRELARVGERLKRTQLTAGDLVFFNTRRRAYSHVGIYLGGDRFLHAPSSGGKVRIERMSAHYWQKRFNGARRVVHLDTTEATASPTLAQ